MVVNGDWSLRILMGVVVGGLTMEVRVEGLVDEFWVRQKKRTANEYVKHFSLKVPLFYY